MKKSFIILYISLSFLILFTSCKDELEDKFLNPEKSTTASLPGFFTGILNNDRIRPSYWNVRTFLLQHPAVYSQTAFFPRADNSYQHNDSYIGHYWRDFYASTDNGSGALGMYRAMQVAYKNLSEQEKADQQIFMQAARVSLYEQGAKMVDLWGDIPFSEAGSLQTSSAITNAKFDSQVELYNMFIDSLAVAAEYFKSAPANSSFAKADILLRGSTDKWRRYANSLRLRLLMRISNVDETKAQTEVMKMLNNPSEYPLIDGNNDPNYNPGSSDVLLQSLTNNNSNLRDALTEIPSYYAPDYMLNSVMLPANDPRIPVIFDKFGKTVKVDDKDVFVQNTTYKAMPNSFTSTEQTTNFRDYAILDSTTFLENAKLPGIVITASEVNFLKAEALERWGTSLDAQTSYETALKQSVAFYYYLYNSNASEDEKLDINAISANVNSFATASTASYAGGKEEKLGLIWTQKWTHLGFLQSIEAWSELRRTDYPKLTFNVSNTSEYATPPVRLVYPSTETSYNTANYSKVQANDLRTTKIFWDVK